MDPSLCKWNVVRMHKSTLWFNLVFLCTDFVQGVCDHMDCSTPIIIVTITKQKKVTKEPIIS